MSAPMTSLVAHLDRHVKVLDTSAILALFKQKNPRYAADLEEAHARGGIIIPDQVLFELTDILPSSLPFIKTQLAEAKIAGTLEKEIRQMAAQSALMGGALRGQIEGVLHFMAAHPEAVHETKLGQHFSRHCFAQLAPEAMPTHYSLTKGDMGDKLKHAKLRVHIGDLLQMGFMHRHDYKDRADRIGGERARKRRFMTVDDFLKMVGEYGFVSDQALKALTATFEAERAQKGLAQNQFYLTYGHLETRLKSSGKQPLLPLRNKPRHYFGEEADDKLSISEMVAPSDLLLEHCFYGGIINAEKIPDVAAALGFSAQQANQSENEYHKQLEGEGFFERRVTLADIAKLEGDEYASIRRKADAAAISREKKTAINLAASNRNSQQDTSSGFDPLKGAAYEYAFVDALINGRISQSEFVELALASGSLPLRSAHPEASGTPKKGVWISETGETCYINKRGFLTRSTLRTAGIRAPEGIVVKDEHFEDAHFQEVAFSDLVAMARLDIAQTDEAKKTGAARVLRAIIYPAIVRDASAFRETAMSILDAGLTPPTSRLLQIEHDWIRRHKNYWGGRTEDSKEKDKAKGQNFPFFTSAFASFHEQRNVARNNLGEIATCELAATLAADCNVAIVTHDKSILKTEVSENTELPSFSGFSPSLARYHGEHRTPMQHIAQHLKHGHVPVVPSKLWIQALKTPDTVLNAQSASAIPNEQRHRA